jgi:tRNA threonylcarbamoyladenosine biosynthesis protein TsaE
MQTGYNVDMDIVSKSLKETEDFAKKFLDQLPDAYKQASVIGLKGDLGAGKTTFVQDIAKILGIEERITSPTFVILKKYRIENFKKFNTLVHIDAYRLDEAIELLGLNFEEEVNDPHSLIFIEWPEKVEEALPENMTLIEFEFIDENKRKITFNK